MRFVFGGVLSFVALVFMGCASDMAAPARNVAPKSVYVKKFDCEQSAVGEAARNKFIEMLSEMTNARVVMQERDAELVIEGAVNVNKMYVIGISSRATSRGQFVAVGAYEEGYNPRRKRLYTADNMGKLAANDLIINLWEKGTLGGK